MRNPIGSIADLGKPFIYFHTHVITREILDAAVAEKRSLEIDISITNEGSIYVGHPLPMYRFYGLPPPDNLPLQMVVKEAKASGVFLILDCKDVRVLPVVEEIVQEYGIGNCLLHACTKALVFKPYSHKITVEPHWEDEQIALAPLLEVRRKTNVPLALCCRGLSMELIDSQGEESVTERILEVVEGNAEVVVPNMPKDEVPPLSMMRALLEHGVLSLINIDLVTPEQRPQIFVGSTDTLQLASGIRDF